MAEPALGLRQVVATAALCVVIVLGAAFVTGLLPSEAQQVVFKTPLLIVVLIVGTAVALWQIARPRTHD